MDRMQDESAHTVNAAAVVLAAAARSSAGLGRHDRRQLQLQLQLHEHAGATKKRWWSWLAKANLACFRPHGQGGHPRRIAAAGDTSPQLTNAHATSAAAAYVHHAPPPAFAFVAPPSSPASSLFASESASPVLLLDTAGTSPSRMFAVGPYAHGPQQLVSPPVLYSTLTTEPSTAPRTPPAIITNPSSPEVPFARFLGASLSSSSMAVGGEAGLFHAYQLRRPGSPTIPLAGSSSPQLFRKLHRRNEGSLLDGHIPVANGVLDLDVRNSDTARGQGHNNEGDRDEEEEMPKSGEFVFGSADGRGAAPADGTGTDDDARKSWQFFRMVEPEQDII